MREREGENDDTINYIRKNDEKHKKNEVIMRWKKSSCMNIINQITMIGRLFGNDEKGFTEHFNHWCSSIRQACLY